MYQLQTVIICVLVLALPATAYFDLSHPAITGIPLLSTPCSAQTDIGFAFSSNTHATDFSSNSKGRLTGANSSSMAFGKVTAKLVDYSYSAGEMSTFVRGYPSEVQAAAVFKYEGSGKQIWVYIPFTASSKATGQTVDLTSPLAPNNNLALFAANGVLTPFNFLNHMDYDKWYSQTIENCTVLVSRVVYRINNISNAEQSSQTDPAASLHALLLNKESAASSGNQLCSVFSMVGVGEERRLVTISGVTYFESSLRPVVAMWFIMSLSLAYWVYYLFTDANTKKIYNREHFTENKWTCWSLYSIFHLAQEEFFTLLSRLTVIMIQLSIQGIIIAAIISQQYQTGPTVLIWAAVIAWAATIVFPFIWGYTFHSKIYKKCLIKYDNMKKIQDATSDKDKEHVPVYQENILVCEEKLYGYFHWFYSVAFLIIAVVWPIAIHLMQKIPSTSHRYNWFWLISLTVVFVFEHFIFEPILVAIAGDTKGMRTRGGYYYDIRLALAYQEVNEL